MVMFPREPMRNALLFKMLTLDVFGIGILIAMIMQGWVIPIFAQDETRITWVLVGVFILAECIITSKALGLEWVSRDLRYKDSELPASLTYHSLMLRASNNLRLIYFMGVAMLFLGISGTVIGLKIGLSVVTPEAAQNVQSIGPMVAAILHGVGVKLSATLLGIIGNLWVLMKYQLLAMETHRLVALICEEKKL